MLEPYTEVFLEFLGSGWEAKVGRAELGFTV